MTGRRRQADNKKKKEAEAKKKIAGYEPAKRSEPAKKPVKVK